MLTAAHFFLACYTYLTCTCAKYVLQTAQKHAYLTEAPSMLSITPVCGTRSERPSIGGVSSTSRTGAPSRTGCVFNGQMTQAIQK